MRAFGHRLKIGGIAFLVGVVYMVVFWLVAGIAIYATHLHNDEYMAMYPWISAGIGAAGVFAFALGTVGWDNEGELTADAPPIYACVLASATVAVPVFIPSDTATLITTGPAIVLAVLLLSLPPRAGQDVDRRDTVGWSFGGLAVAIVIAVAVAMWVVPSPTLDPAGSGEDSAKDSNCSPNYEPCVRDVEYDLDCPDVGTSVKVVGDDVYGLDRDGDGIGCEVW